MQHDVVIKMENEKSQKIAHLPALVEWLGILSVTGIQTCRGLGESFRVSYSRTCL